MKFVEDDGGRADAGYVGHAGDCVTRSIAIATGLPYKTVYDTLAEGMARSRSRATAAGKRSARNGVLRTVYEPYLLSLGWEWVATMQIGSGCQVHLADGELPMGNLVVRVSKHITAVIDGVIHDLGNPSRGGSRCVYGYFQKG